MVSRHYDIPPLKEPLKGNELLIASIGPLVRYIFEDPYLARETNAVFRDPKTQWVGKRGRFQGEEISRVDRIIDGITDLENNPNSNVLSGILKSINIDPRMINYPDFIRLIASSCRESLRHLRAVKNGGNRGDREWDSGSSFNQAHKILFSHCLDYYQMTEPDLWRIFDAIFDTPVVLDNFASVGNISTIAGLESELQALLYLRNKTGSSKVNFASRVLDSYHGIDIILVGDDDCAKTYIQVKSDCRYCQDFVFLLFPSDSDYKKDPSFQEIVTQSTNPQKLQKGLSKLMWYVQEESKKSPKNISGALLVVPQRQEKVKFRQERQKRLHRL